MKKAAVFLLTTSCAFFVGHSLCDAALLTSEKKKALIEKFEKTCAPQGSTEKSIKDDTFNDYTIFNKY